VWNETRPPSGPARMNSQACPTVFGDPSRTGERSVYDANCITVSQPTVIRISRVHRDYSTLGTDRDGKGDSGVSLPTPDFEHTFTRLDAPRAHELHPLGHLANKSSVMIDFRVDVQRHQRCWPIQ
jgi:hypothetical protein